LYGVLPSCESRTTLLTFNSIHISPKVIVYTADQAQSVRRKYDDDDDYEKEVPLPAFGKRNKKTIASDDEDQKPRVQPPRKRGRHLHDVSAAETAAKSAAAAPKRQHYFKAQLSSNTSVRALVTKAVTGLRRRSTIRASDGNKEYHELNYTMAAIRPSKTSWMPNPSDLSLQSIMTHVIQRGYELIQSVQDEDRDMDQPCFDFLRDLPPPTLADMVVRGGMTPEQVRVMDGGHPFTSNEFFATAASISHGKTSISIYLARLLLETGILGALQAYHYAGAGTKLYGTQMHDRGTDHWDSRVRAVSYREGLIQTLE
jgi:hypothetical protein